MRGKNKCKILKQIRQKIAHENDIPLVTQECTYQGECSGTCPRCESELRYLEQQLARRQALGKAVTVAALSVGLMSGLSGCTLKPEVQGSVPNVSAPDFTDAEGIHSTDSLPEGTVNQNELDGEIEALPTEEIVELEGDVAYVPDETDTYVTAGVPTAADLVDGSDFTEATTEPNE
ncbi:MAG: hypothetical protein J6K89_03370 [Oscillospiraceae bacterium]|nr:hypothetical protein [Oscillospiraceae bacterium]